MKKNELFRGVIKALKMGPLTIEQICYVSKQPKEFVVRELERWKQCGPVRNWLIHDMRTNKYCFKPSIKDQNIEIIAKKINQQFNKYKYNMDLKMDLQGKGNKTDTYYMYKDIDKYLKKS